MATPQQCAQTVVWYAETKSIISVQRNYQLEYGGDAPDRKTIKVWFEKFLATGSVLKQYGELVELFPKRKWKKFERGFREARGNQFIKHQDNSTCRLRVA
jgi:hypothetical protein